MRKFYFLLLSLIFVACNLDVEDEEVPPVIVDDFLQLKEVFEDNVLRNSFEYDGENRLTLWLLFDEDGVQSFRKTYSYDDDTTYTENYNELNQLVFTEKVFRLDDQTVRLENYEANGTLDSYQLHIDNVESCDQERVEEYAADGTINFIFDFQRIDDNCGYELYLSMDGTNFALQSEILFDEARAYNELIVLQPLRRTVGNARSNKFFDLDNGNIIESYTATFDYNDLNYPTTEIRTFDDDSTVVFRYTYN